MQQKSKAIENLYGKMPRLARFRQVTKGHTMRPQPNLGALSKITNGIKKKLPIRNFNAL